MKLPDVIAIAAIDAVEIAVEPWTWPFTQARHADIDRHFAARRERSAFSNGRMLLLHRYARGNRVLRGASFETDYASFLAWRDWLFRSRRIVVNESAEQLRANIMHRLADEAQPEFTAVRIVRRPADVDPDTPRFYVHYLMGEWSCPSRDWPAWGSRRETSRPNALPLKLVLIAKPRAACSLSSEE